MTSLARRLSRLEQARRDAAPREAIIVLAVHRADADKQLAAHGVAGRLTGRNPVLVVTGVGGTLCSA